MGGGWGGGGGEIRVDKCDRTIRTKKKELKKNRQNIYFFSAWPAGTEVCSFQVLGHFS